MWNHNHPKLRNLDICEEINTSNANQNNTSLLITSNLTRVDPDKLNSAETQEKNFKISNVCTFTDLKVVMMKCINEIYETTKN